MSKDSDPLIVCLGEKISTFLYYYEYVFTTNRSEMSMYSTIPVQETDADGLIEIGENGRTDEKLVQDLFRRRGRIFGDGQADMVVR